MRGSNFPFSEKKIRRVFVNHYYLFVKTSGALSLLQNINISQVSWFEEDQMFSGFSARKHFRLHDSFFQARDWERFRFHRVSLDPAFFPPSRHVNAYKAIKPPTLCSFGLPVHSPRLWERAKAGKTFIWLWRNIGIGAWYAIIAPSRRQGRGAKLESSSGWEQMRPRLRNGKSEANPESLLFAALWNPSPDFGPTEAIQFPCPRVCWKEGGQLCHWVVSRCSRSASHFESR